jgi:hypothetical protein
MNKYVSYVNDGIKSILKGLSYKRMDKKAISKLESLLEGIHHMNEDGTDLSSSISVYAPGREAAAIVAGYEAKKQYSIKNPPGAEIDDDVINEYDFNMFKLGAFVDYYNSLNDKKEKKKVERYLKWVYGDYIEKKNGKYKIKDGVNGVSPKINRFTKFYDEELLLRAFGKNLTIGSKYDFGIKIKKDELSVDRSTIQELVGKYPSLSLAEDDDGYMIMVNKEVSNSKMVGLALATIAGITFAYNVAQGNVGFETLVNNPVEFFKSFLQVKYHEVGTVDGYVSQHFDDTHVDGMRLEGANGDINMHDADVNMSAQMQDGHGVISSGTFHLEGQNGVIVYNQGTPYETTVPVTVISFSINSLCIFLIFAYPYSCLYNSSFLLYAATSSVPDPQAGSITVSSYESIVKLASSLAASGCV